MQRSIPFLIATATLASLCGTPICAQGGSAGANDHAKVIAAAPGRIEGSAEAVDIGGSIGGIVETVAVKQGDRIVAGQLLVRVDCSDIAAQLEQRKAEYEAAVALYEKLVHGPRPQEIEIGKADVELAQARLVEAQSRLARSQLLLTRDGVSRADYDAAERDGQMAAAQLAAAQFRLRLLEAGTREEDLAEGKARTMAAQNAIAVTQAELAKCDIRSPVDGIVVSKHVSVGELVSIYFPKPLVTVAEVHRYRVRAEIDENDVPLVNVGQKTDIVVAASLPRLHGVVASLAPGMGRRKILTSDPADKSDRDVREVLIDIEGEPEALPIGLRVSVLFY
jgi:multidrug resistance efflux pump